jgi:hypothetical protein
MGTGPIVTGPDIYHTNNPYPVELPEDLRRVDPTAGVGEPGQEMLLDGEEFAPADEGDGPLPAEVAPPPEQYNPPANPNSGALLPIRKVDGRVFLEDTLTPPAPPRIDTFGN